MFKKTAEEREETAFVIQATDILNADAVMQEKTFDYILQTRSNRWPFPLALYGKMRDIGRIQEIKNWMRTVADVLH